MPLTPPQIDCDVEPTLPTPTGTDDAGANVYDMRAVARYIAELHAAGESCRDAVRSYRLWAATLGVTQ